MRIRYPFAGAFVTLLFLSAYAGLLPHSQNSTVQQYTPNDKLLHLITFFLLTLAFYFILDTSRRRVLNLTLVVCTFVLGIGSEVIQGFLPNDRVFDPYDILANLIGSLSATGLASWYHKRMLERRRKAKYAALGQIPPDGDDDEDENRDPDLELGEGPSIHIHHRTAATDEQQESGIVTSTAAAQSKTLEEEVDNWDENAADDAWDDDIEGTTGTGKLTPPSSTGDDHDVKLAKD